MKLTRTSLIMLLSGILVIAFAGLGMAYSRQSSEKEQLNQDLAQAQLILDKAAADELLAQKDELEKRLTEGEAKLQKIKTELSPELQSIESSDDLFIIAEKCAVEVLVTKSTPPSGETRNGIKYSSLEFRVTVEGEVADIIRFIQMWTEEHPTGLVESVRIMVPDVTRPEGQDETDIETEVEAEEEIVIEEEETEESKPTADIELIIYTYQGK